MTLTIGNNLIAKPTLLPKGEVVRLPIQRDNSSNTGGQPVTESSQLQAVPILPSNPAPVEVLQGQGLAENATEGIFELSTPDEVLDWTDDTPPTETELQEIELTIHRRVKSVDSTPDGSEEDEKDDKKAKHTESEGIDSELSETEEELVQEAA